MQQHLATRFRLHCNFSQQLAAGPGKSVRTQRLQACPGHAGDAAHITAVGTWSGMWRKLPMLKLDRKAGVGSATAPVPSRTRTQQHLRTLVQLLQAVAAVGLKEDPAVRIHALNELPSRQQAWGQVACRRQAWSAWIAWLLVKAQSHEAALAT
jgi:hypothetical protein